MLIYLNFPQDIIDKDYTLGEVVEISVAIDSSVQVGQLLAVFQIQNQVFELYSPYVGKIRNILVKPHDQVAYQQAVFDIQVSDVTTAKTQKDQKTALVQEGVEVKTSSAAALTKEQSSNPTESKTVSPIKMGDERTQLASVEKLQPFLMKESSSAAVISSLLSTDKKQASETAVLGSLSSTEKKVVQTTPTTPVAPVEISQNQRAQIQSFVTRMFSEQNIRSVLPEKDQMLVRQWLGNNPQESIGRVSDLCLQLARDKGLQFIPHDSTTVTAGAAVKSTSTTSPTITFTSQTASTSNPTSQPAGGQTMFSAVSKNQFLQSTSRSPHAVDEQASTIKQTISQFPRAVNEQASIDKQAVFQSPRTVDEPVSINKQVMVMKALSDGAGIILDPKQSMETKKEIARFMIKIIEANPDAYTALKSSYRR
jgi:hypothetical protein